MMPTPVPPTPEEAFYDLVEEFFLKDAEYDDKVPAIPAARRASSKVFPSAIQRKEDAIALAADKPCRLPGGAGWNNREYINLLVAEAERTPSGAAERPEKIDSFRLYGNSAEPDEFSGAERRSIRDFIKWLILHGPETEAIFKRLVVRDVWSIGDFKKIGSLSKASNAQTIVRSALSSASEFKDDKARELGVEGAWKGVWGSIKDYTDIFNATAKELWQLRAQQRSVRTHADQEALEKSADGSKLKVVSFVPENEAIFSRLAQFAAAHGDITEYARLSPSWDGKLESGGKLGWVKIPDMTSAQRAHVEGRIARLKDDPATHTFAVACGRTDDEIALLREVFFRSKVLVDILSGGLDISWEQVWDNLGNGPVLIDLLMAPSGTRQAASMAARTGDRIARGLLGAQPELAGKWGPRISTVAVFLTALGFVMVIGVQANSPGL